jgi:GH15 family glucan-1,4-alpha-glucosidase
MESSVVTTLEHPVIQELEQQFEIKKILSFHFGNLQVRTMSNLNRIRIDNYLEVLKRDNWKSYDGKIRRVHMITELYYGSIQLILKREMQNDLEAIIKQLDLDLVQTVEFGKSVEYTFKHKDVPFAMRLERLREFNG